MGVSRHPGAGRFNGGSGSIMPITVFLSDDHAIVRDGLRLLLEMQEDLSVVGEAAEGREAVRRVEKLRPDVVLMDISMPELNGIEATQRIRESCPSTRVIILSMYASAESIYRALKAGANGYLLKESAGKEVIAAVRTVHKGNRYLSRRIDEMVVENYLSQHLEPSAPSPLEKLSSREREILQMVVEGKSSLEISRVLFLSPKTVETYRSRLMEKLGIHDIPNLVKFAITQGLTSL
jgi:DNA-binding NarL/FixJ family response regulator